MRLDLSLGTKADETQESGDIQDREGGSDSIGFGGTPGADSSARNVVFGLHGKDEDQDANVGAG